MPVIKNEQNKIGWSENILETADPILGNEIDLKDANMNRKINELEIIDGVP